MTSLFRTLTLALLLLIAGCTEKKSPEQKITISCSEYNWSDVEMMVQPYLPDELNTALVMQALSSEYKVSAAADHALGMSDAYPDSDLLLLKKI